MICLPEIEGHIERYKGKLNRQIAEASEFEKNLVLAYYLDDEGFELRGSLEVFHDDNFVNSICDARPRLCKC